MCVCGGGLGWLLMNASVNVGVVNAFYLKNRLLLSVNVCLHLVIYGKN